MDKPIAKKPVYYRYRWHIAGGIAFIAVSYTHLRAHETL